MLDILLDTVIDVLKLIPFLYITYLIMEYIENKTSDHAKQTIKKSGKWGPLIGGLVGVIPQCGFSASATNLYAARVISLGTLISVYLSTSDEMLPIFLSESIELNVILRILGIKLIIGIIAGFIIDYVITLKNKGEEEEKIVDLCEHEHCHCHEEGILKSALRHTLNITVYIFIITLIINIIVEFVGPDNIASFIGNHTILGPAVSSLVGLIPNCAASVIIANLYIQNVINGASLIAGLLTGAGVGLIVLFRMNKNIKENIKIMTMIYLIGVISGIVLQLIGWTI
ncbi:MAG: arsenic efflux protein [Clostridia bacterium]|nr:arsenic efflux protein [Clostridia bacterium]